jgi:hypothetical protein
MTLSKYHTQFFQKNTSSSWVETPYQWLKDNLNVFIITGPESITKRDIAATAVNKWVDLLRNRSNNFSTWNVSIYKTIEGNYTLYKFHPPDITVSS